MTTSPPSSADPVRASPTTNGAADELASTGRRHLRFGWWSLLVFLTLGLLLEGLHGLKVGWYLDAPNTVRRLMWTLAHAHGALLGLVNVAFGATLQHLPGWNSRRRGLASACLLAASVLLPGGFFLGGLFIYGGDPGLGILLVPAGALPLFVAVLLTARGTHQRRAAAPESRNMSPPAATG